MNLRSSPEVLFWHHPCLTNFNENNYSSQNSEIMRKLTNILLIATALLIGACEGPVGPIGPPGQDGINILGSVFEIQGDFTPDNSYTLYTTYPSNLEVYESDVVLVYILWETADGMDVWRLMPQTVVLGNEGVIQYNYDYTYADVQIFLEFTIPEANLLPAETDNQVFRIAVVPADFVAKNDVSEFSALQNAPNLELKSFDTADMSINSLSK